MDDLWMENDARDLLEGQTVKVLPQPAHFPPASYRGDKNVKTVWKWCEVLTGPCTGDQMWIAGIWMQQSNPAAANAPKKCNCPTRLLMTNGCKCGGI